VHGELLMLALVFLAALLGGRVAARFGYPSILGELVAGIVFGPPLLGWLEGSEALTILGETGVLLMMLYIGMHLDLGDLRTASRPGLSAAIGGFVVPAGLGFFLMSALGYTTLEAVFVGLAMGVTSLATKSRILVDLKILDTRVAYVLMAGALISDLTVLVVFAAVVGPDGGSGDPTLLGAGVAALKAIGFGLVAYVVGTRLLPRFVGRLGRLDRMGAFLSVVVTGLLFGWGAELAGLHAILGAFVAGLFLSEAAMGPRLSRDVQRMMATVSVGTLAPIFFVTAGFDVSFGVFATDPLLVLAVVVLATVGKVVGTALFYALGRNPWREGMVVGAGMNGRGAVEIIVAEIALAQGIISVEVFSVLVFMAIITTATVPVLLTRGVAWLRRRGELVKAGDRRGYVVVGAGPVARELASLMAETSPVTLVDTNRTNLDAGRRMGLRVVNGSGLDDAVLVSAGVERAAAFLALTPNTEVNVLAAQLATGHGVPEVAVLVGDGQRSSFEALLADQGIVRLFPGSVDLLAWDHAVATGTASRRTMVVEEPTKPDRVAGVALVDPADDAELPLAVVGGDETRPWSDAVDLRPGDEVVFITKARRAAEVSA
jgi:Kef-type K+ transport system membrane component KefB